MILLTPVVACASPITYTISNLFSAFSVSGTITTDGKTGLLSTADITGWDLVLKESQEPSLELTTMNSQERVFGTNSISASSSGLFMNYSSNGGLVFQYPAIASGTDFVCYQSSSFFCFKPNGVASEGININGKDGAADNYAVQSGTVEIGAARMGVTPEPNSLLLLGTGLAGFAGLARRRFRTGLDG